MGENIGRIFKASEESVIAIGDEGKSGDSVGKMIYSIGCGTSRAYIGLSDDGIIGDEEGTGRSIYHRMAEGSQ